MRNAFEFSTYPDRSIGRRHISHHARTNRRSRRESIGQTEVVDLFKFGNEPAKVGAADLTPDNSFCSGVLTSIKNHGSVRGNCYFVNWTRAKTGGSLQSDLVVTTCLAGEDRFWNHRMHAFVTVDQLGDVEIGSHTR